MARNILKNKGKPKVIKTYRQSVPATRFIGKQYGDEDRHDGGFGRQWGEWFQQGWFDALEKACPAADFEDAGAYIGLMYDKHDENGQREPFQYWVGMFFPEGTEVPEGFGFVNFPAVDLGVAWLCGKENTLYMHEAHALAAIEKSGMALDREHCCWCFERYACPRFTTPDRKGKIILDICHFAEKEPK